MDADGLALYGPAVNEVIEIIVNKYLTIGKPVLLGFSGGGIMVYYQSVIYGSSYSAIFPVSGKLTEDMLLGQSTNSDATVYAFHGQQDKLISIANGRNAIEVLKKRNVNVQFNTFNGGHLGLFTDIKSDISQMIDEVLPR